MHLLLIPFSRPLLLRIGGDAESIDYAAIYTWITIIIGGIPTILASTLAHLIRSTGQSRISSIGITFGAVLNMVLDPLFMFVLLPRGNEVMGAALTTTISNAVSVVFFLLWLARHKENEVLRFRAVRTHTVPNRKSAADTKSVPVSNAVQHPGRVRVLCIAVAIYPLLFVIITVFQAVGDSIKPFFLSLLHKGSVDIVLYFVIRAIWGLEYILWASPIMDAIAVLLAVILYRQRFAKKRHF